VSSIPAGGGGSAPTLELIQAVPKVLLHDHLDGGLRPATVVELAAAEGYPGLPTTDPDELGRWFTAGANQGNLELYLEGFAHTVAVMQTPEALTRVAAECAEDLAADGIVYAEVRFAPELHVTRGLSLDTVVEAVLEGFRLGSAGRDIRIYGLLTAMRTAARSLEIAETAVRFRDTGIVGFDIAGAESGSPPTVHLDAFQYVQREDFHITIHAGEAFGLPSIWEALQICGSDRLGHGVRIVDDIHLPGAPAFGGSGAGWHDQPHGAGQREKPLASGAPIELGRLASYVRDRRVPLEMCPTSNVQTGAAPSLAEHPIGLLRRLQFRVTVNTDNRLMSGVTLSSEMAALVETFGYDLGDLRWFTLNAMKSAFAHFDERLHLINNVIKPGYAGLARKYGLSLP
jgi:adenosine deaminase